MIRTVIQCDGCSKITDIVVPLIGITVPPDGWFRKTNDGSGKDSVRHYCSAQCVWLMEGSK